MNFATDKQTLDDLSIFPNANNHRTVLGLFSTKTLGGKDRLEEIFSKPLINRQDIKDRVEIISYFQTNNTTLSIDKQTCDFIEFYLKPDYKAKPFVKIIGIFKRIVYTFNSNNTYYVMQQGVDHVLTFIDAISEFFNDTAEDHPKLLREFYTRVKVILSHPDFALIKQISSKAKLNAVDLATLDNLFRRSTDKLKDLLEIVYWLDVYISVSISGKELGFNLPIIKKGDHPSLAITGLFHPFVKGATRNDIDFSHEKNLSFITGTNMAGKSTMLKAVGIAIYLSQCGLPVPADYMETGGFDGLMSTINLGDDIDNGNSHFYNEVLRVKQVAEKISQAQNIFVIFDELFRGTNVKDAYDASLAIISAFAKVKNSFFMVSTHIIEVANDLKKISNIDFRYMETIFDNETPRYTYQLKNGITEERLGMWIVKNEGIVEIIENSIK